MKKSGGCLGCLVRIFLLLAVVVFVVPFIKYVKPVMQNLTAEHINFSLPEKVEHIEPVSVPQDLIQLSYYQTLNEEDRQLYNRIYAAVMEHTSYTYEAEENEEYSPERKEHLFGLLQDVLYDHPEIFWASSGGSITFDGRRTYTCEPDYYYTKEEADAISQQLSARVNEIASEIQADSDYEKVVNAYEWIIRNTDYDYDLYEETEVNAGNILQRSAVGCLLYGKTVCSGYTKAFQLLMHHFNIPCTYLSGTLTDGRGLHAWNLVQIDGGCYHVDTTWGDPTFSENPPAGWELSWNYLCLTDSQIMRNRTIAQKERFPEATDPHYGYYVYNGFYLNDVTDEGIWIITQSALDEGKNGVSMQFATEEMLNDAVERYITGHRLYSIVTGLPLQINYMVDSSSYVLTLLFHV